MYEFVNLSSLITSASEGILSLGNEKDDDNDQDPAPKDSLHMVWSWSPEDLLLRRWRTITMTKIPSRKTCYAYGHGHLKILLHFVHPYICSQSAADNALKQSNQSLCVPLKPGGQYNKEVPHAAELTRITCHKQK